MPIQTLRARPAVQELSVLTAESAYYVPPRQFAIMFSTVWEVPMILAQMFMLNSR